MTSRRWWTVVDLRFSNDHPVLVEGPEITVRPVGTRYLAARPGWIEQERQPLAQQLSIYSGPNMSQIDYAPLTSSTAEALSTAL